MLHPTLVNIISFFYPVGNTPAVCLTQDLPHEQEANVLLLGCGDVRNILFTSYSNSGSSWLALFRRGIPLLIKSRVSSTRHHLLRPWGGSTRSVLLPAVESLADNVYSSKHSAFHPDYRLCRQLERHLYLEHVLSPVPWQWIPRTIAYPNEEAVSPLSWK